MVFRVRFNNPRFTYVDYVFFLSQLEIARRLEEPRAVVSFEGVGGFYPNGMAPFVATVLEAQRSGIEIAIEPPSDTELRGLWKDMGWTGHLFGIESSLGVSSNPVPLTAYSRGDELNDYLDASIHMLADSEVLPPGVLTGFEWSANEVADNVLVHAQSSSPGWVQLVTFPSKNQVEFVVVDTGRGIRESLSESFKELKSDQQAVALAIERGITRSREIGLGNGLSGTVRIAEAASGYVNIHSGTGQIRVMDGDVHQARVVHHQGTLVTVTLSTRVGVDVAEALWGHEPVPTFEARYVEDGLRFVVAKEAGYLGNRHTGGVLRTRLLNFATVHADEAVYIDFDGVNMVTASFVDEFLGLLARDIGIEQFRARYSLLNVSRFAAATIDGVMAQRFGSSWRRT